MYGEITEERYKSLLGSDVTTPAKAHGKRDQRMVHSFARAREERKRRGLAAFVKTRKMHDRMQTIGLDEFVLDWTISTAVKRAFYRALELTIGGYIKHLEERVPTGHVLPVLEGQTVE